MAIFDANLPIPGDRHVDAAANIPPVKTVTRGIESGAATHEVILYFRIGIATTNVRLEFSGAVTQSWANRPDFSDVTFVVTGIA